MNQELQLILNIAVAVAIALAGGLVAHWLRQSPLVGYLLAGMMIGPFTSNIIRDREQIASLAEAGVIFLMFALGIEFSLKELARIKGAAIGGTVAQVLITLAAGTAFGMALGWPLTRSIFFGGIISVSSTMVILKTLMSRGEVASNHGRLLLGMLIVQDLAVVVLMLLLPKIGGDANAATYELFLVLVKALLFIGVTLLLGVRVVPRLMAYVEQLRSPELFILTAVALALGSAMVSARLGLSPALGAFMAGLMLTETDFDHRVMSELIPMRDLFATLFFVSIGMLIDVGFIMRHLPAVLGTALFIIAVKVLTTMVSMLPFRLGGKTVVFASLGMIPIGEFNYVLAHVGQREGVVSTGLYNLILTSSLLTIILTPAAFWIAPRVDKVLARLPALGRLFAPHPEVTTEEQHSLDAHAIVIGYGRVGQRVTRGLRQAGMPVVVIEQDLHLVRELAASGIPAVYGDASYANVLAAAHPERARLIVVALPDFGATRAAVHRANIANPNVPIVARAQRAENDVTLRAAGATSVVVPEIAGALMLLEETLILLGLPHDHILTHLSALSAARVEEVKNQTLIGQGADGLIATATEGSKSGQSGGELSERESSGRTFAA